MNPIVEKARDLWMDVFDGNAYYKWLATVDMPDASFEEMTNEDAERAIRLLSEYKSVKDRQP